MMKYLRRCLLGFCFFLALIVIALCSILYTDVGLKQSLALLNKITDNHLSYKNISGQLAGTIMIDSLHYQSDSLDITIRNAKLKFNPWDLLLKRLSIDEISAKFVIIYQILASDNTEKSPSPINLPVLVTIKHAAITQCIYKNNLDISVSLNNLALISTINQPAKLTWEKLVLQHKQLHPLISHGKLTFKGSLSAYTGKLISIIKVNKSPNVLENIVFNGNQNSIELKHIILSSKDLAAKGSASLSWYPTIQWKTQLKLTHSHLNPFSFQIASTGKKDLNGFVGELKAFNLNGKYQQKPLAGNLDFIFSPNSFQFKDTKIQFGDSTLAAKGGFDKQWTFRWSVYIKDFRDLFDMGSGTLNTAGTILGQYQSPLIQASVTGSDLSFFSTSIAELKAKINVMPTLLVKPVNSTASYANFELKNIVINHTFLRQLTINILGNFTKNTATIRFKMHRYLFTSLLQGGWQNSAWQGAIRSLNISNKSAGMWHLLNQTNLQLGINSQQLSNLCLNNNSQRFCIALSHSPSQTLINGKISHIKLESFLGLSNPSILKTISATSLGNGQFNFQKSKSVSGQLNLIFSPGIISEKKLTKSSTLAIGKSSIIANITDNQLTSVLQIGLAKNQTITGKLVINHLNELPEEQIISGNLVTNYHDFSLIPSLFPVIQQATGKFTAAMSLSGTVAKPVLSGHLSLQQGLLTVPSLGLTIKDITLNGKSTHSGELSLAGRANSGAGLLAIKGNISLLSAGIPLKLSLTGQNVLVMKTSTYEIYASPKLTIERTHTVLNKILGKKSYLQNSSVYTIDGSIVIPKAIINSPDFGAGTESLSDDVQFLKHNANTAITTVLGNINLILGNSIQVAIKGLTGKLIGKLGISLDSMTTTTATGTLEVQDGSYQAYGQNLNVTTGKIIYTGGPINNPGIELVGSKTILTTATASNSTLGQNFSLPTSYTAGREVTVGITVDGTLQHYTVNLFSDPAIYSQSDILALILTGQTTMNLSGNNAQLLLKAASGLNLGTSAVGNITQELQQFFGLDELGIDSKSYLVNGNATQTTALTIGKHLTPRLSISYSIGLLEPISIFTANYSLTKNWNIQTNASSQDNGADIFYSIEK